MKKEPKDSFHVLGDVALDGLPDAVPVVRLVLGKRFQLLWVAVGSNLTDLKRKSDISVYPTILLLQ